MSNLTRANTEEEYEKQRKRWWIKYLVTFGIASVIAVLLMWFLGLFQPALPRFEVYRALSDAFFVTGMLVLCVGALVFVNRNGTFDALVYSVKYVATLYYNHKQGKKSETFYEFKQRKAERENTPCLFLIIIGGLFVLTAGVFTLLFFRII